MIKFLSVLIWSVLFLNAQEEIDTNAKQWQLSKAEKTAFDRERFIQKTLKQDDAYTTYIMLKIDETPDSIFKRLMDFEQYDERIDSISDTKIYFEDEDIVKVKMTF